MKLGHGAVFLYLAFVRTLQLLRLARGDGDELAIEVVMLRHEVAVRCSAARWPVRRCGPAPGRCSPG